MYIITHLLVINFKKITRFLFDIHLNIQLNHLNMAICRDILDVIGISFLLSLMLLFIIALGSSGIIMIVIGAICIDDSNSSKHMLDWCPVRGGSLAILIIGIFVCICCCGITVKENTEKKTGSSAVNVPTTIYNTRNVAQVPTVLGIHSFEYHFHYTNIKSEEIQLHE